MATSQSARHLPRKRTQRQSALFAAIAGCTAGLDLRQSRSSLSHLRAHQQRRWRELGGTRSPFAPVLPTAIWVTRELARCRMARSWRRIISTIVPMAMASASSRRRFGRHECPLFMLRGTHVADCGFGYTDTDIPTPITDSSWAKSAPVIKPDASANHSAPLLWRLRTLAVDACIACDLPGTQ